MQEAILFTVGMVAAYIGLGLMHVAAKIAMFFIKEYKAAKEQARKATAEVDELRAQVRFYENMRQITPTPGENVN